MVVEAAHYRHTPWGVFLVSLTGLIFGKSTLSMHVEVKIPALDRGFSVTLPPAVENAVVEALMNSVRAGSAEELDRLLKDLIVVTFRGVRHDHEESAPTNKQISYARAIASRLGIPIPSEALAYRSSMSVFLNENVRTFNDVVARSSTPAVVVKRSRKK